MARLKAARRGGILHELDLCGKVSIEEFGEEARASTSHVTF